jgi:hypothetical protein
MEGPRTAFFRTTFSLPSPAAPEKVHEPTAGNNVKVSVPASELTFSSLASKERPVRAGKPLSSEMIGVELAEKTRSIETPPFDCV